VTTQLQRYCQFSTLKSQIGITSAQPYSRKLFAKGYNNLFKLKPEKSQFSASLSQSILIAKPNRLIPTT